MNTKLTAQDAAQLADLGESPVTDEELRAMGHAADVALVGALLELSETARGGEELHGFARRRVLRTLEGRLAAEEPSTPSAAPASVATVLAAVAAAALVVLVPGGTGGRAAVTDPAAIEALSAAAHGGLSALGDLSSGARAREVAARMGEETRR